jgi:hypothetical protein
MPKTLPDSLPQGEKDAAKALLRRIGVTIILKRKFYFTAYAPRGLSCVDAAVDRGHWLVNNLPSDWFVDVYTWRSYVHTANLVYFRGSDSLYHCWIVDGYGYPVTENAVVYAVSQAERPGDSLLGGDYNRTMADGTGIKGVFPARGKGCSLK